MTRSETPGILTNWRVTSRVVPGIRPSRSWNARDDERGSLGSIPRMRRAYSIKVEFCSLALHTVR